MESLWGTEACKGSRAGVKVGVRGAHSPGSAPRKGQFQLQ